MSTDGLKPPHSHTDENLDRKEEIQMSAGGVLYRKDGNAIKVCLIAKKGKRVWALPKGRVDPGETPEVTAQREVLEETGHFARVADKIDAIDYYFFWKDTNTLYHKVVYFYLMPLETEGLVPKDSEADAVAWFTLGDAYRKLTYLNEKEIIRQAQRILKILKD
jgi:8-oxo-dGTP diphosphatase